MKKLLITMFGGLFGLHKFMERKWGQGFLYLFTCGIFGIGWIIDIFIAIKDIFLPSQTNKNVALSSQTSVPVSNSRVIRQIKAPTNQSLDGIFNLIYNTQTVPSEIPADSVIANCDLILSREKEILDDCKKIISSTDNPEVFFRRYDLLLKTLTELQRYEPFIDFYGYQPSESLVYYSTEKQKNMRKMIDRCYNKALVKADGLKTEKGKQNQFIRSYEILHEHFDQIDIDNLFYLNNKFKKKLPENYFEE